MTDWVGLKNEKKVLLADIAKLEAQLQEGRDKLVDQCSIAGNAMMDVDDLKAKLQASEAGAAALRQALVGMLAAIKEQNAVAASLETQVIEATEALSTTAGADMLAEVERLREVKRIYDSLNVQLKKLGAGQLVDLIALNERAEKAEKLVEDVVAASLRDNKKAEKERDALVIERDGATERLTDQLSDAHGDGQRHAIEDVNAGRVDDLIAPRLNAAHEAGFNACREAAAKVALGAAKLCNSDMAVAYAVSRAIRALKPEPKRVYVDLDDHDTTTPEDLIKPEPKSVEPACICYHAPEQHSERGGCEAQNHRGDECPCPWDGKRPEPKTAKPECGAW